MVQTLPSDTIRILVATDNHVGYAERDSRRGNDSAETFDEIMQLAKERDVDMILLAGDLFHDNKPSRKSMYEVMRSLRQNCFGDKPCELQMLSDASEVFQGTFNHANYEDEDLNIAIPVFSIHGNHDDPSGEGHFAALDLLQVSGLVNYYGRVPESDNIDVKPVLLQKGRTKLALYGLSNVRDERLFRTFRDKQVKFFQPGTQKSEWFNLLSVHQNHHAYTDTGYLPENFLPDFMDLVVWGHEHECLIDPSYNPEMGFHVMQPGSSVATSLSPGEAVPKHVAILSVTGKEFKSESIRLKSVRPFVMREIVLQDNKKMKDIAKKGDNRTEITRYLEGIVNEMIEEAQNSWAELQDDLPEDPAKWPKPLVRLRVEYTAPEGGKFDCENPQRFSNRFSERVANANDVVQFHRKKKSGGKKTNTAKPEAPDEEALAQLTIESVKVDQLVQEFLTAQSLTILPQNTFGDAVMQFVDKDDTHAVKTFVNDSLDSQVKHLIKADDMDEDSMANLMEEFKAKQEELFQQGHLRQTGKRTRKPDDVDSDMEVGARASGNDDDDEDEAPVRTRGKAPAKTNGTTKKAAASKKAPAKTNGKRAGAAKGRKRAVSDDEDDEDDDVIMVDDDDDDDDGRPVEDEEEEEEDESQGLFVSSSSKKSAATWRKAPAKTTTKRAASPKKATARASASKAAPKASSSSARQSRLQFSQPSRTARTVATRQVQQDSDDEISDDDDAFAPAPSTARSTRGRK